MFSASQLTEDQKDTLHRWAAEGATLSDLQRRMKDDFGIVVTYMDIRFLVLDLDIEIREEPKTEEKKPEEPVEKPATGTVTVTMDTIALPGALVSGRATFRDGETAVWMVDQTGRMGLDPDTPGYRPGQEDIAEFQSQLRTLLRQSGY
jgi:hypothetical protein